MAAVSRTAGPRLSRLCGSAIPRYLVVPSPHRLYHSYEHEAPPPFSPAEDSILSAALAHVPNHGFTALALTHGAQDAGYLDVSTNLFPRGPFDLINYHLVTQRLALKDRVQFPDPGVGVGERIRSLTLQRLKANKDVIRRWQEVRCVRCLSATATASLVLLLSFYSLPSTCRILPF